MPGLNIAVVGGGIGGPCAAIALAQNGHKVTVYERTATTDVGFAFRITPNSDLCLKYLGVDTVDGGAVPANTTRLMDHMGNVKLELRENTDAAKAKKATSVFAYRVSAEAIEREE
jgi:salicylate hydroxylase